jgi:hypothetical protein
MTWFLVFLLGVAIMVGTAPSYLQWPAFGLAIVLLAIFVHAGAASETLDRIQDVMMIRGH